MLKPRPSLLDRLGWWWVFRDVRALDVTLTGSGGRICRRRSNRDPLSSPRGHRSRVVNSIFVELHTRAWRKRCIVVEITPDEAQGLADQIRDMLDEPAPVPPATTKETL